MPEILAPVGNWEMCQAAVHNGADAIYVGMPKFNARGRTHDFEISELKEMIDFCHLYGVRVLIAFNVLIFQQELESAKELLLKVIPLAPDAFIVQDAGLVRLIKKLAPAQAVHASTQMTVTNFEAIEITSDLDITRYVLGREVSIAEIQKIRERTEKELEVFVHGALCVSYSGQCLTSERIGGRSANRGQCAQSCRLEYDLIVDDQKIDLGDRRYLVSPKDLCSLEDLQRLREIGINSFKIEGRLKSPEYVAATVQAYKTGLEKPDHSRLKDLETVYSRGFFNGWMDGVNHQMLVDGRYSSHQGRFVGTVAGVLEKSLVLSGTEDLSPGEGLVFCDFSTGYKAGSPVYAAKRNSPDELEIELSRETDLEKIRPGMSVFLNSSPFLEKNLRSSFEHRENLKRIEIDAVVSGAVGTPLELAVSDDQGKEVKVLSRSILEPAKSAPVSESFVKDEISALSSSPYRLRSFSFQIKDPVFIHHKELKDLRRRACEQLTVLRQKRDIRLKDFDLNAWLNSEKNSLPNQGVQTKLNVLLRDAGQIPALKGLTAGCVYLDFEFGKDYAGALTALREQGHKVGIATTRILKPGESAHLKQILRLKPDRILVRNLGALHYLKDSGIELIADFSLNVTNSLTADWLLSKGVSGFCPSYDLNQQQLFDLLSVTGGDAAEVTVHQYMPAFHMEHCVFAAFLSRGSSFRDCGRPCEKHRVELRASDGSRHPLKADAECRNTMFHGVAHSAASLIPRLQMLGVRSFRFEALYEEVAELRKKLLLYLKALDGKQDVKHVLAELQLTEKYGVSEGQLHQIGKYKDRKKSVFSQQAQAQ